MKNSHETKKQQQITRLKKENAAREQAEKERDRLFNLSIDMLCIAGFDGYLKQLNPAWEQTLGWTNAELMAKPYLEFVHPEDREPTIKAASGLADGKTAITFNNRYLCKNGTYKWISWNSFPLVEEQLILAVARDITQSKQMEEELNQHREHLEELVQKRTLELKNALEQLQQEITVHKRGEEKLQVQFNRLDALRAIDQAIAGSLDIRIVISVILDRIAAVLEADAVDVLLLDPHTHLLEFSAGRGFRTSILQHTRLILGDGYAGRAALERQLIHIPNLQIENNSLKRAPLLSKEGFVAYYGTPLIAKGQVNGVLEVFHRKPFNPDQEWLDFLEALAGQAAIAIDSATLFNDLQRSNVELLMAYDRTLEGWSKALDLRDKETEGHTLRVTELTLQLARTLGVSEEQLVHIRRGALLHDIGKMGIPDSILLKPGALTEEEWVIMRKHPVYAYELLFPITYLRPAVDIPYCHHEKWDGSGYPRGLKEDQIPLAARIFAIIDVWDAVRSDRPYRPAWPEEKAIDYLRNQSGTHFDPKLLDTFLSIIPAIQSLQNEG